MHGCNLCIQTRSLFLLLLGLIFGFTNCAVINYNNYITKNPMKMSMDVECQELEGRKREECVETDRKIWLRSIGGLLRNLGYDGIDFVEIDEEYFHEMNDSRSVYAKLKRGEIDMLNGLMAITQERWRLYNMVYPVSYSTIVAYISSKHRSSRQVYPFSFLLNPFLSPRSYWLTLFVMLVTAFIFHWLLLRITCRIGIPLPGWRLCYIKVLMLINILYNDRLKADAIADLGSAITVDGLAQLIRSGSMKVIIPNGISYTELNTSQSTHMATLRWALKENPPIVSEENRENCRLVAESEAGSRMEYMYIDVQANFDSYCSKYMCRMTRVQVDGFSSFMYTFVTAPNATRLHRALVYNVLQGIERSDDNREKLWRKEFCTTPSGEEARQFIDMKDMKDNCYLFAIGIVCSIAVLLAERVIKARRR